MEWSKGKAPTIASQAILFAAADYADEWGITYAGQDTLAADCSCRKATVADNLKRLEEHRVIARVRRHDQKGHRTSDHIVLAPLAGERGGMRDADKRATEKHPPEVCALARRLVTPGVTGLDTPDGRLDTPHGHLDTPGVPEPSVEPSVEPGEGSKAPSPTRARVELPADFPAELRLHLTAAYRVLRDLAVRHGAREVSPIALANVVMGRPRKPLVLGAHDFASWADGQPQPRKDVVAGYRRWLDKMPDLAAAEQLDEHGRPCERRTPGAGGTVVQLQRPAALSRADRWRAGYGSQEASG